jgi:hypothetical protein
VCLCVQHVYYIAFLLTHKLCVRQQQLACIQKSVRTSIESALRPQWETEKPRDELLMTYCTQIALITANVMWVEEVETCLASTIPSTSSINANRDTSATVSSDNGPLHQCFETCTANINTMINLLQVELLYTIH